MSIIWLVENPCAGSTLRDWLIGNFAVRNFASLASLITLAKRKTETWPDVVLCNSRDCSVIPTEVRTFFGGDVPWFFVATHDADAAIKIAVRPEDLEFNSWLAPGCLSLVRMLQQLKGSEEPEESSIPRFGFRDVYLDLESMALTGPAVGDAITLTAKELKLMRVLLQNAEQCIARSALNQCVWGDTAVSPRTLDTHVSRLRKLLQPCGLTIESIYGGGYRLCVA